MHFYHFLGITANYGLAPYLLAQLMHLGHSFKRKGVVSVDRAVGLLREDMGQVGPISGDKRVRSSGQVRVAQMPQSPIRCVCSGQRGRALFSGRVALARPSGLIVGRNFTRGEKDGLEPTYGLSRAGRSKVVPMIVAPIAT